MLIHILIHLHRSIHIFIHIIYNIIRRNYYILSLSLKDYKAVYFTIVFLSKRVMVSLQLCNYTPLEYHHLHLFAVSNDVKQGGVISPILFCIYMNELID